MVVEVDEVVVELVDVLVEELVDDDVLDVVTVEELVEVDVLELVELEVEDEVVDVAAATVARETQSFEVKAPVPPTATRFVEPQSRPSTVEVDVELDVLVVVWAPARVGRTRARSRAASQSGRRCVMGPPLVIEAAYSDSPSGGEPGSGRP